MKFRDRPIRAKSKKVEKKAIIIVKDLLNEMNWTTTEEREEDFGIDIYVTVFESQDPLTSTAVDFVAQVKGTQEARKRETYFSYAVDINKVLYWRERPLPVLFLLVDEQNRDIYWVWVKEFLKVRLKEIGPKWRDRQTITLRIPYRNRLTLRSIPDLRRLAARMVWPVVHENLCPPKDLRSEERSKAFPFRLEDLPYPYISKNSQELDLLIVSGPTRYELENMEQRFDKDRNGFLDRVLHNKIVLGESSYNLTLCAEILSVFCYRAAQEGIRINRQNRHILPYTAVDDKLLQRSNLILIPCGDVNPFLTFALQDFEMLFLTKCPVHHSPYDSSEKICYEVTGDEYEKRREERWGGYILMIPNPWNPQKACLICGGNKGVGTQAALLRLLAAIRGDKPLVGRDGFPVETVRAVFDPTTMMVNKFQKLR